ncbi:MAG: hypothetical protein SPJ19_07090 [Candidatus Borkfalkiaceae bacterium]|nr:hypothetical protein [Christensenellaceae bacterium]
MKKYSKPYMSIIEEVKDVLMASLPEEGDSIFDNETPLVPFH